MGYTNKSKTKYKLRGSTDGFYRDKNGRLCLQKEKITPVEEKTLFQKGSFDDGYQFGDVTKAILGTTADAGVGILKGAGRLVEGVVDLGGYGVAEVADLFGADKFADNTRKAMQVDAVGKMTKGIDEQLDKHSLLGYYSDAVAEGAGQVGSIVLTGGLGASAGLGTAGVTALTTGVTGLSSMGSGIGEAYQNNATDGQAWAYGAMKGAVDMASEWIFGGLGKGVKALGLGKGLTSIDDVFARKVSGLVTKHLGNETAQKLLGNTVEYAIKSGAEGLEEVLAGIGTAYAKKFSYMSEKDIDELKKDENLLEQFIVGSLTSAIAQGGDMFRTTTKGQDFITGRTASEQKALDAEVNRLTELYKKNGEKVKKSEIYDEAEYRLKKGYIGTDTIESIIGEKAYSEYKKVSDAERAETERLNKEISSLEDKINSSEDISTEDRQKLSSLRSELESLTSNSKVKELKEKLDTFVRDKVKGTSLAESYNEIARQTEKFKADLSQYTAKEQRIVQKAIDSGVLNNTNRSHELVDLVAKLSADKGINFDFTNNAKLKESGFAIEGKMVNGFVNENGITINTQSQKYLNSVVGHEITHILEGTDLYTELQNSLFEYAKAKNDYQDRYDELTELYKNIKGADVNKELTADLVGDYLFTDPDFLNHLFTENRNVFQKIYDEIKYLCKIVIGTKEEKALLKAKKIFDDVYSKGETKAVEGVKFSLQGYTKDGRRVYTTDFSDDVTMDERVKIFKDRIATVFNLGGVELKTDVKKIKINGDRFTAKKNLNGDYYASDSEMEAKVNSLYDAADILATSKYLPQKTQTEPSYADKTIPPKNKAHKGVKYWYKFQNEIVFDGVPYTVTFNIRDKGKSQYQYLIEFKKNKTPGLNNTVFRKAENLVPTDRVSNTIIRNSAEKSTGKLSLSPIVPEIAPNGTLDDVTLKTPLNDTGTENILGDDTPISEHNTYSNYENSTQVLNNQNKNDIINSTEKPFNTKANEKETYTSPEYETFETRKIVEPTDMQADKKRRADAAERYGLTSDEATRLADYVGGQMCYILNKRMTNGTLVDGDLGIINSIRNALLKTPEYSGRTYRNLQFNTEKEYNDFLSEYSKGNKVKLKAFTSTSKLPNGYTKFGNGVVHLVIDGISGRDIADTFGVPRQQEVIYLPETEIEIKKVMIANDGNPLIFAQEVKTNENIRTKETGNTGNDRPKTSVHQDINGQGTESVRDGENNSGLSEETRRWNGRDGVLSQRGKSADSGNVRVDNGQTEEKAKENTTEKNEDTKQIDDYIEPITQTSSNGDVFFDGNTATLENDNTVFDAPTKEEVNEIEETTLDNKCISSNMSDAERSQILKSKKLENIPSVDIIPQRVVESISNDETIENISSWEDINKYFGSEKRTLIQKIASEFGVFKDYNNSDINIEFTFSRNDYRESYGKQKHNFESFAKMFSVFDKVVENAIGIEVHNRNDEGYKPDVTLKNSYVLISAFSDGDLIYPVKLEVKEFSDKKNSLYVAISLEAIKKTEVSKQGTTENGVAQNSRSVNISIADLMQKVNPKNTNFTKYFPEEILTQEQKRILKPEQNTSNSITVKERSFANTAMESDIVGGKILHEDLSEIAKRYVPTSNETTLKSAGENLANEGYEKAAARLTSISESNSDFTLMDIAESELLLSEALRKGDTKTAGEIIENLAIIGTELGQKVQALSLINRMTPEGQLRMLEKIVKYNQKNISKKSDKAPRMRDKSFAGVKITEEIRNTILSVYKEDGTFDQNALNEAVDKAKQMIADQMSVSYKEKLNAWRYLSMLGNPKTHLRNTVSNVAMTATIEFKDALARTIESVVPIKNRTKTWKRSTQAVKEFAKQTTEEMESVFKGEGKYGDTADIKSKRKIFDTEILQKVYGFNSDVLTGEDVWFKRYNFNRSLSEFLTANGIETAEDIKNNPELVEKGKRYALEQAEIATFQQHSALASEISKWSNRHDFLGVGLDAILPFKKTPINIAKAGLNYSPLGFAKTIAYDIPQLIEGNINASKFIDDISQNITGTGLMLLGYALASLGFLNGAGEDDEEGKFDYQLGEQSYSVAIGDNTYSLDWLSPVAMPLFVGANAFETFNRKEGWSPDVVIEALAKTADPLSEMSILSSLDEVLSSYSGGTQRIGEMGKAMTQSYIGQYIPTILSQTAATFDDVKRTTKASSNSGFTWLEETARAVMYKIPGLRNLLEPSIDIWGNEIKQNENFALRAIENFASVTSRKQNISSDVSNELKNLFNEVGESGILPSIPKNLVTYKGEQYAMSAKEYTDFKKEYGQQAYNMLNELFNTSTYKNATFEQKAEYVDDVYTYARENAKKKYFETKEIGFTNSSRDNVPYYKENSIKSAIENDMTPEEYEYMTNNPEKHAVSLIFGYENFAGYKKGINKIEGDRDKNGNTINGSAKEKRIAYINSLNLKAIEKKVLFKSVYPADDTFNKEIVEYILGLDMKTEEKVLALKGLGFKVDKDGNIRA